MFVSIVCKCTLLFMNEEIIFCFYLPVNGLKIHFIKNRQSDERSIDVRSDSLELRIGHYIHLLSNSRN